MMTKTLRPEERLEIAIELLTGKQTDEYERICTGIELQRKLCGFPNVPVGYEDKEYALHLLDGADRRIIGCPCVS